MPLNAEARSLLEPAAQAFVDALAPVIANQPT